MLGLASAQLGAASSAGAASPGTTSTLVNFDGAGTALANQVTRFDTAGNAIDAEEGQIAEFADPAAGGTITYVLYGESHNCGFQWHISTSFCGFNSYTSPDLVHWTYRGKLFDPQGTLGAAASAAHGHNPSTAWQSLCGGQAVGCFRPHVVYNSATQRFVLWFYAAGVQSYYVMTSLSPYAGFVLTADGPYVDPSPVQTDHYLFVDPTSTSTPPAAYIAHAYWGGPSPSTITIDVQRLNNNYDGVVGPSYPTYAWSTVEVSPGDRGVEAPAMFERAVNGTPVYYLTYSDPHCGYGISCGVSYLWALSPAGPWGRGPVNIATGAQAPAQPGPDGKRAYQAGSMLNSTSCGGQPTAVSPYTQQDGTTGYLFQSNLNYWTNGTANQGLSKFFWAPLSFDAAGTPQPFSCSAQSSVSLKYGVSTSDPTPANADQRSVTGQYQPTPCTIGSGTGQTSYTQIVTAGRTGTLTSVSIAAFLAGTYQPSVPNGPLTVSVVPTTGTGAAARPTGAAPLATSTFDPAPLSSGNPPANSVGWSLRTLSAQVNVAVVAGTSYGITVSSAATAGGCYGLAISDPVLANPYSAGALLTGSGTSWTPVTGAGGVGRSARFSTTVTSNINLLAGRPVTTRSVTGFSEWTPERLVDQIRTSVAGSAGYHSVHTNTNPLQPEWAVIDMGQQQVVNRMVLCPAHPAGYGAGFGFPVRFQLRVSNDPTFATYTVLVDQAGADVANPGDVAQTYTPFANLTAQQRTGRYLQLYVPKLPNLYSNIYAFALAELEAFST